MQMHSVTLCNIDCLTVLSARPVFSFRHDQTIRLSYQNQIAASVGETGTALRRCLTVLPVAQIWKRPEQVIRLGLELPQSGLRALPGEQA